MLKNDTRVTRKGVYHSVYKTTQSHLCGFRSSTLYFNIMLQWPNLVTFFLHTMRLDSKLGSYTPLGSTYKVFGGSKEFTLLCMSLPNFTQINIRHVNKDFMILNQYVVQVQFNSGKSELQRGRWKERRPPWLRKLKLKELT